MKNVKKLVCKHGQKHRALIINALTWFEKNYPESAGRRRIIGPETFVDALIEKLETEKRGRV